MRSKSLQRKLFSNYVFSIFLGFILFSFALFLLLTSGLYKKIDNTLISEYEWMENFLKNNIQYGENYVMEEIAEHISPGNKNLYAMILADKSKIAFLSENLKEKNFLLEIEKKQKIDDKSYHLRSIEVEKIYKNDLHLRLLTRKVSLPQHKDYIMAIATPINDVKSVQKQLIFWLLIIIPVIGVPFALWSKFSAMKISRPLEIIDNKARKITINRLSEKINIPSTYREVENLTHSFNQMIKRLEHSIFEIKRFTSDASHELRTPLTVLKSQIQVALREKNLPHEFRKMLEEEFNEVIYMEKIVNNLLFLSRYDAQKIELERTTVDFSDLVIEQCERKKEAAEGLKVRVQLGEVEPVKISGDRLYLSQMVSNLLDNALKYNKEGGQVVVEVKSSENKRCLLIIKDTGLGIPEEDLTHVFERFYRVDKSRSRKVRGSGLGLSIVKLIVELHRGEIKIESQEGKGTTITVRLPLLSPEEFRS